MAEKKISVIVVKQFSTGSKINQPGDSVELDESTARVLIACGKAREAKPERTAGGKNAE